MFYGASCTVNDLRAEVGEIIARYREAIEREEDQEARRLQAEVMVSELAELLPESFGEDSVFLDWARSRNWRDPETIVDRTTFTIRQALGAE